jgi:hypothetical protein
MADTKGNGSSADSSASEIAPFETRVLLYGTTYADTATVMQLPRNAVVATERANTCFVCPAGNFCALGTKRVETQVQVAIEGRVVAIDEPIPTAADLDRKPRLRLSRKAALRCTEEVQSAELGPSEAEPRDRRLRVPFFVAVASIAVPEGSIVTATLVDKAIKIVQRGTPPQRASFTIDASAIDRPGSALGVVGTGVGFATMTRFTARPDILEPPAANAVSPLLLGLRYDVALFSEDWLHRLSVVMELDHAVGRVNFGAGADLGLAASFENGPNSTIHAGFLAGLSAHVDWQVAWQIATVFGVTGQGIFINGNTQALWSAYVGPRVGF